MAQRQNPKQQIRRRRPERQGLNVDNFFDVYLRCGLDDDLVRLSGEDYQKLILQWQLGAEDVILRGGFPNSELQVILRGTSGGRMRVSRANAANKVPVFEVFTIEEIMATSLQQHQENQGEASAESSPE
jgi:hypothetical protein